MEKHKDSLSGETLPAKEKKKNPRSSREEIEAGIDNIKEEIEKKEEKKELYVFPPLTLLARGKGGRQGDSDEYLRKTARKLQQTLQNFGVQVTVTNVSCGPTVTRYELQPEQGVKVSKIVSLTDDIKLNLACLLYTSADEADTAPAQRQLQRYLDFLEILSREGISIPIRHCSNSAGIIRLPQANLDVVRAGITIYGIYPSDEVEREPVHLQPVMEWKTHISYIKETGADVEVSYGGTFVTKEPARIATIPVGYADGYPRSLSGKGQVLIRGQRAPILGRICMDQFMVDVTHIPQAEDGDEVTLLGAQGDERITADELGRLSGRFPYEFVCCISKRVPRVYR